MIKAPEAYKTVTIIGGGLIGHSFGILFSRKGLDVRIYNRRSATYDSIRERMRADMEFLVAEGAMRASETEEALSRVTLTDDLRAATSGTDYVQECLWEDLELKRDIFKKLTDITPADLPIASSCSGLRISEIASLAENHPERCIVAHPTNPPHLIPFMEIAGDKASREIKDSVYAFMESIGQKPIRCKEVYGYVLNRLQLSLIQEAIYLVKEGICDVADAERAVTDGLGLRWAFTGPYGVEELNSANLEDGLRKYKDYMIDFFVNEQRRVEDYDEDFIEKAVAGFVPLMNGRSHDSYLKWRNRMLIGALRLKREDPL
jgi:3-hydroxyacyl-CoA dehydrogenase